MKLRIQNNTLRVRLNEREVSSLHQGQVLKSQTWFPGNILSFTLAADQTSMADFVSNEVKIKVNIKEVEHWAKSDEVTIAMEFHTSNDEKLSILVEKDMKI
jgi:hypothetical protein